jgi:putative flippase GtrA
MGDASERIIRAFRQRRPLRFVVIGLFNTAVSYGSYSLLVLSGINLPLASLLGLLLGIFVGFLTQGRIVFGNATRISFLRFVLAWSTMYFVHLGIVLGLMRFGVHPVAGGAVALCVITALSYFVLRDLVFRADAEPAITASDLSLPGDRH